MGVEREKEQKEKQRDDQLIGCRLSDKLTVDSGRLINLASECPMVPKTTEFLTEVTIPPDLPRHISGIDGQASIAPGLPAVLDGGELSVYAQSAAVSRFEEKDRANKTDVRNELDQDDERAQVVLAGEGLTALLTDEPLVSLTPVCKLCWFIPISSRH